VKESLIQTLEVNISSIINSPDIFNLHFITKLYQFLNNKLFDLKNELFGFIDTVYSTAKIQKPESISADEFKAICNTIDVYAPLISKAKGNTYTKKYPNWHAYFESFSNNCRVILKEFYTFANHLDIEFLGLLSQIDSLIYSNFQRWSLRYVDDRGKSTVGPYAFYLFFAAAFCKEANEYFSAKYGSLQRKAMDNFRGITTKHKTLKLL
jgi:hypothetical protein